jgi:hypothetical protein
MSIKMMRNKQYGEDLNTSLADFVRNFVTQLEACKAELSPHPPTLNPDYKGLKFCLSS